MTVAPAFFLPSRSYAASLKKPSFVGGFFCGPAPSFPAGHPAEIRQLLARELSGQPSRFVDASCHTAVTVAAFPMAMHVSCPRLRRQIQIQLADRRWQMYVNE
jgi:hypothetical protein